MKENKVCILICLKKKGYENKDKKKGALQSAPCRNWLGWKDLNPRNDGVRVHCLTAWLHPNMVFRRTLSFGDFYSIPHSMGLVKKKAENEEKKSFPVCYLRILPFVFNIHR